MMRQLHKLSQDQFGCRIIQKAIVWLPLERQLEVIKKFDPLKLVAMMFNEEGNYIVQCIMVNLPQEHITYLLPLI